MGPLIRDKNCSVAEEFDDITEQDLANIIEEFESEFPFVDEENDDPETDPLAI